MRYSERLSPSLSLGVIRNMKTIIKILLLLILTGCGSYAIKPSETNTSSQKPVKTQVSAPVKIRIKNHTEYDMQNVLANFGGEEIEYGNIPKGAYSKYFTVKRAYRYAYVEWEAKNKKRKVQPKDYVGEKELESGNYTYIVLPFEGEEIYYDINLEKD